MNGLSISNLAEDRTWGIVASLWLLAALGNAALIVPASIFPLIMENMGIAETKASWIVSVTLGVQMLVSIPIGFGIDRWNNRNVTLIATALFTTASIWGWYAAGNGNYISLLFSRALIGIALITLWNAGMTIIGDSFEFENQATIIGIYTASAPAGFTLGQLSGPLIAARVGWPATFAAFGIVAVGAVALFWASTSRHTVPGEAVETPTTGDFKRVLTNRTVWHISVMNFTAFTVYIFLNSWMPTYLNDVIESSLTITGLIVALFPAMGILSRSAGGVLSDVLFASRRRPVEILAFVITVPTIGLIAISTSLPFVALSFVIAGFAVQLGMGIFYTHCRELVAPNVAATVIGILSSVGLIGAFSAPILTGFLIERTQSYQLAFGYVGVLGAIGLLLAWIVPHSPTHE
jgi:nitrate/nitrite transporter NarK